MEEGQLRADCYHDGPPCLEAKQQSRERMQGVMREQIHDSRKELGPDRGSTQTTYDERASLCRRSAFLGLAVVTSELSFSVHANMTSDKPGVEHTVPPESVV